MLALLWTVYVMLAVAGSVLWVARFTVLTRSSYGPAARIMLVVVAVGIFVLWPMVRLSQATARGGRWGVLRGVLGDVVVILIPVQTVLWPLLILAAWPLNTVLGVAGVVLAWTWLVGGVLALALGGARVERYGDARALWRTAWMVGVLALVLWGPAARLALGGRPGPSWLDMASPLTAVASVTGVGLAGPQGPLTRLQWAFIAGVAGVGTGVWGLAWARAAVGGRRRRGGGRLGMSGRGA